MQSYLRRIKWNLLGTLKERGVSVDCWGQDAIMKALVEAYFHGRTKVVQEMHPMLRWMWQMYQ